jgi:hypothetical protein
VKSGKGEYKVDAPSLETLDPEELVAFIGKTSPDELESLISKMNIDQIKSTITQIDKGKDDHWNAKTRAAILGLNKRPQLEAAANRLSVDQVVELIDKTLQVEDKHHWKLSPLLIAISFEVFLQLLSQATDKQLQVLQHEGVTEPVQHQLTALSHELSHQIESIEKEIDLFYQEIENIDLEEIRREEVLEIKHKIGLYSEFFEKTFQTASRALRIAWNTNRLDLIESLNKIKDSCQKYNIYGIGVPKTKDSLSTGMYKKLDDKLLGIFGDPADTHDRDALRDEEPAIEGLVKFSVWYLRDYWDLGLLPEVKNPDNLDLDLAKHSEAERTRFREDLFAKVQANLEKIGLTTVADLKDAYIFSKKTLQEYIQDHLI